MKVFMWLTPIFLYHYKGKGLLDLDGCGEEKISYPHCGSNPEPSRPQRVAIQTTQYRPFWKSNFAKERKKSVKNKENYRVDKTSKLLALVEPDASSPCSQGPAI
jgi:hypothetical protein